MNESTWEIKGVNTPQTRNKGIRCNSLVDRYAWTLAKIIFVASGDACSDNSLKKIQPIRNRLER